MTKLSYARIEARLDDLAEARARGTLWAIECECDDFEVDDLVMIRDCAWNDENTLAAELNLRDAEAGLTPIATGVFVLDADVYDRGSNGTRNQ